MVFGDEDEAEGEDDEDSGEDEDLGDEEDFDNSIDEEEESDADQSEQDEDDELIVGAARWKRNIANKAKESFVQRQLTAKNLHSVIYWNYCTIYKRTYNNQLLNQLNDLLLN
jgi:hypothetical protein